MRTRVAGALCGLSTRASGYAHSRRDRARLLGVLVAGVLLVLGCALPATALASTGPHGRAPSISQERTKEITQTGATVQARISPHGLETRYAVEMWGWPECDEHDEICTEIIESITVGQGTIPPGRTGTLISVPVVFSQERLHIEPGTGQQYWIDADNAAGETESPFESFTTLPRQAPQILSESVSHLNRHDTHATLEATINPGGLETHYEFWVNSQPCLYLECELVNEDPELRAQGTLPAGAQPVKVHARLTGLFGGLSYEYWVKATNTAGSTQAPAQDFPPETEATPLQRHR